MMCLGENEIKYKEKLVQFYPKTITSQNDVLGRKWKENTRIN